MKTEWLLLRRFFWNKQALSARASLFALGGLSMGVAVLYVALSVMSGFEKTLQTSLTDVRGHLTALKRSAQMESPEEFFEKLKSLDARVLQGTPFLAVEGVVAGPGMVQGVLIQGLDEKSYKNVLKLEDRILEGEQSFKGKSKPGVMIGRELAQRLGKTLGDKLNVVVPRFGDLDTAGYRRTVAQFEINAILDLGKYEWNERLIVAALPQVQKLAEIPDRYAGLLLRIEDAADADEMASSLITKLGSPYWVRDWKTEHENTFEAVEIERRVIFLVVLILVVVAVFSLASNLLLQTLQKASEMAVLTSMGLRKKQILRLFIFQGLALGLMGVVGGVFLGWLSAQLLTFYQAHWGLISASVYRISHIDLSVRAWDLLWIFFSTLILCALAGFVPAYRASKRQPAEGLRYE